MRLEYVVWIVAVGCTRVGGVEPEQVPAPAVVAEPEPAVESEPEPAVEPEPEPPAEPEFAPVTRGTGRCVVTVAALIDAQEYRGGGPMTPALEASLSRDPDFARMYEAESHGDYHIQCHYEVTLRHQPGKRHRWRVVHSNTTREHDVTICGQDIAAVAEDIIASTKQCTDLDAGAYWGYVLEPIP